MSNPISKWQRLLALWHYPRWLVRIGIVAVVIGYIASAPIAGFYLFHNRTPSPMEFKVYRTLFMPIHFYRFAIPPLHSFLNWEEDQLYRLHGKKPPIRPDW